MTQVRDYRIPFNRNGDQLNDPQEPGVLWVENFTFHDTLVFIDVVRRGKSIAYVMERTDGALVSMFLSDFTDIIAHLNCGRVTGSFTFTKKGQNYGCRLVHIDERKKANDT